MKEILHANNELTNYYEETVNSCFCDAQQDQKAKARQGKSKSKSHLICYGERGIRTLGTKKDRTTD